MAMSYIKLDTDISILLNDPVRRPKAAKGVKTRPSYHIILQGEVLPGKKKMFSYMDGATTRMNCCLFLYFLFLLKQTCSIKSTLF